MERRRVLRLLLGSAGAAAGMSVSSSRAFFNAPRDFENAASETPSAAVATGDDIANARAEKAFIRRRRRCYYYRRYGMIRRRCVD